MTASEATGAAASGGGVSRAAGDRKQNNCCGAPDTGSAGLLARAFARLQVGRLDEAVDLYRQVLARQPSQAEALHGLGLVAYQAGKPLAAEALMRRALAEAPNDPDLLNNLGTVLRALNRVEEAIVFHHRAIEARPDFAEAHSNLGNALRDYGRLPEASLCYERALRFKPDFAEAYLNYGNVLRGLGRLHEAVASYRRALGLNPALADAHNNLGTALKDLGQADAAAASYRRALDLNPNSATALYNLANMLSELERLDEAAALLERALELQPQLAEAHLNLGNVLKNQGRLLEAVESFQRALAVRPGYGAAHSNLLFTLNYLDGVRQRQIYDAHRQFHVMHAASLAASIAPHQNAPDPDRRLKIGYVSPDFRQHACAYFLEPLLANHDRGNVEVYAYAEVTRPDPMTARLRARTDQWRSTCGLNDEQVAEQIRADGVDVLVDLAGHTANSRLLVFARKPAPVQVSYLGYPATTGLDTMDYRLTDAHAEPEGASERWYTERLVRLPHSLWCYQPLDDMPEVSLSPAERNGFVTFGSFNNFAKIGPRVLDLWAELLQVLPASRLLMICVPEGAAQRALIEQFGARGIGADRLRLYGRLPRAGYLALYSEVDIALDPFPCNGGTTTCDALWMGLPVIALIGDTFLSRAGLSVLASAGLSDLAAATPGEYIAIGARLSADIEALAARRAAMRTQLRGSPLMDARRFARDVEQAYRAMWRQWCAQRT
jgi:predicted O-linked N-acetylglucosamine transferase (SPINDLY family)